MTHPLTPREKVVLKPCPFCGGEAWLNDYEAKYSDLPPKSRCPQCRSCGASLGYLTTPAKATKAWNRRTALASSGDHAELAGLAEAATPGPWETHPEAFSPRTFVIPTHHASDDPAVGSVLSRQDAAFIAAANPATVLALIAENAALRDERDQIAGESIWWKGVIGDGSHQPSGEVRSIKHLHPAMVKPIYEANKGTAVADVIAGLIFLLAINQNREQFLVADANERRTEAERKLVEAVEAVKGVIEWDKRRGFPIPYKVRDPLHAFLSSKEAERG